MFCLALPACDSIESSSFYLPRVFSPASATTSTPPKETPCFPRPLSGQATDKFLSLERRCERGEASWGRLRPAEQAVVAAALAAWQDLARRLHHARAMYCLGFVNEWGRGVGAQGGNSSGKRNGGGRNVGGGGGGRSGEGGQGEVRGEVRTDGRGGEKRGGGDDLSRDGDRGLAGPCGGVRNLAAAQEW